MTGLAILDVARDGIFVFLKVAGPLMIVALVVGLAVSLVQALTQIQEQTLDLRAEDRRGLRRAPADAALHGRRTRRLHDPHRGPHRSGRLRRRSRALL